MLEQTFKNIDDLKKDKTIVSDMND